VLAGRPLWGRLLPVALFLAIMGIVVSCAYFVPEEVPLHPPLIEGAEYVGSSFCAGCHEEQAREFRGAPHAAISLRERDDADVHGGEGCEACHGPGSLHVMSRGDKTKILKGDRETCMRCHMETRMQFRTRFRHPVMEGRMSCSSCHDPHSGMRPVRKAQAINDTCLQCHPNIRGPWTFPHDAIAEEGCVACHHPHGSNIPKMLTSPGSNLCIKCHFQDDHPRIGNQNHANFIPRGACYNCHKAVHGSNFSPSLRTQ
jgi:predicted CXXCH cytochrome family protein